MKWGLWSTTAGSNSATPPDGWPEGQLPSTVNDCAREMMAQIRTGINNIQFIDLGITPTETGNTTFTLAGNQMQWYPYGNRVAANVGGTLYYGTVISSSFTTNTGVTLRFDPGANQTPLTTSLSAVATGFPSSNNGALPENAFVAKNWFHNAEMDIWQRGPGPASLSSGLSVRQADRWLVDNGIASAGCTLAVSRAERSANASNVPTLAQAGKFLNNALRVSCNVAVTGLAAADFIFITQIIEGYDYRKFAGKPLTVSFWVNSTVTGTYCCSLRNGAANQTCILQYSISSVSTWEQKTLTFPKPPLTGTWNYSSGNGLQVNFVLAAGSTLQGGAGNWTATGAIATSAQVDWAAVTGAFMMTGLQLQEGTSYTPLPAADYFEDFARCQRYLPCFNAFGTNDVVGIGQAINTSAAEVLYTFPVTPRIPPTGIIGNQAFYLTGAGGASASGGVVTAATFTLASYAGCVMNIQVGLGGLVPGNATFFIASNAASQILFTGAEL